MKTQTRGWRAALLAIVLAIVAVPDARTAPRSVDIPFRPEVGQRVVLEVEAERERYNGSTLEVKGRSRADVDVQVIGRAGDGWVYRWTFGEPKIVIEHPPEAAQNPIVVRMAQIAKGLKLEFETDAVGQPTRIVNIEEARRVLAETVRVMIEEVVAMARKGGAGQAQIDQIQQRLGGVARVYGSLGEEQMAALFLEDAQIAHGLGGGTYGEEEAMAPDRVVAGRLGGPALKADTTARLKELAPDGRSAVVEVRSTFDPASVKANLAKVIPDLAGGIEQGGALPADMPAPEVSQSVVYSVDTATGFVHNASYEKRATLGDRRMIQRKSIVQRRAD